MKPACGSSPPVDKLVALLESWGPAGAVLLAVLDSSGVPLPASVDIMLLVVGASQPGKAYLTAALCIIGSAIGSMFLFYLARKGGQVYLDRHTISPRARKFREWFGQYGLVTVLIPTLVPLIPLPLKVFVLSAGALGVRPRAFLLTILAGRIPRYLGLAYLGSQLGSDALGWLQDHRWHLLAVALSLFAVLLLLVKIAGRRYHG
jgi:membrane protein DedA with SNARE-associated domain